MKTINLREYYPYYENDTFVEVPDEVAEVLHRYKLKEAADYLRTYRHRAFYSLDLNDGTEYSALPLLYQPTVYDIIERKRISELLYAQKFENAFYKGPDLREVKPPQEQPQAQTLDLAALIDQLQKSPELVNTLAALLAGKSRVEISN